MEIVLKNSYNQEFPRHPTKGRKKVKNKDAKVHKNNGGLFKHILIYDHLKDKSEALHKSNGGLTTLLALIMSEQHIL